MPSVFIDPKIDYAFKMIFGRAEKKEVLISLLNAMIYDGKPMIADVVILNPYLPSDVEKLKDTYVDIHATLSNGGLVLIEMQMVFLRGFFKRVLYNNAKRYSSQLVKGESYPRLTAVISLIVTNFVYNESSAKVVTKFKLKEETENTLYPAADDFQIVIAELPKFRKRADELTTLVDHWLFFLQYAQTLEEVPQMIQMTEVREAFEIAKRVNLEQLELIELERRELDALAAQQNLELTWAEGVEEGIGIGREEGRQRRTRQMISQMLGLGLPLEQIAQIAEMTVAEIRQIEQEQALPNGRSEP